MIFTLSQTFGRKIEALLAACKEVAMVTPHPGENSSPLLVFFSFSLLDAATINSLPLLCGEGEEEEEKQDDLASLTTGPQERKVVWKEMKSRSTIWADVILNTFRQN